MHMQEISTIVENCKREWPSPLIARTEIFKATGGLISERYQANIDANPTIDSPPRFRCGRKVVYPRDAYFDWLKTRMAPINKGNNPSLLEGGRHES